MVRTTAPWSWRCIKPAIVMIHRPPNINERWLAAVLALVLYVLSVGPIHGLYYTDQLSYETWSVMKWLYYPVNRLESQLPDGEPIHTYKYWWYLGIKYHPLSGAGLP